LGRNKKGGGVKNLICLMVSKFPPPPNVLYPVGGGGETKKIGSPFS